ncbi:Hexuronic acid methyltransferase AglP [uncultured archaeon]|nr:Hexuronic acid methyltransferase AglP [uncultured archaeon]
MKHKSGNILINATTLKTVFKVIILIENWHIYFKDFFGKFSLGDKIVFDLRNGVKNILDANSIDIYIFTEIWIHEQYNPKGFNIKENDTVIDIGANSGIFSIYAGYKASKGKVYSFEPVRENFEKLKENIILNRMTNVITIEKAVSNTNGTKNIFLNTENNGGHSFFNDFMWKENETGKEIKITTISLQGIFDENKIEKIDFLKCDCEGAEYEIFFPFKELLKKIDRISMEVHRIDNDRNVSKLKAFLEESGFAVKISPNYDRSLNMLYAKNLK